jgi:hypothetical protein
LSLIRKPITFETFCLFFKNLESFWYFHEFQDGRNSWINEYLFRETKKTTKVVRFSCENFRQFLLTKWIREWWRVDNRV